MHVQNVHTMDELKMTGNCLKGSRGLLSFDKGFEDTEWGRLTKEVFTQVSNELLAKVNFTHCSILSRFSASLRQHERPSRSSTIFSLFPCWIQRYGSVISRFVSECEDIVGYT